jgi:hypothetical protein
MVVPSAACGVLNGSLGRLAWRHAVMVTTQPDELVTTAI